MTRSRLTGPFRAAKTSCMVRGGSRRGKYRGRKELGVAALMTGTLAISGCISVNAPDKPIVIELNINIKQEVIYRLAADAENTIEENADIF